MFNNIKPKTENVKPCKTIIKNVKHLEMEMLKFIDKNTWHGDKPRTVMVDIGNPKKLTRVRIKIRWKKIRCVDITSKKQFTKSDIEFNKALNNLKSKKLITSRTKCQYYDGLTTTNLGHDIAKNQFDECF